MHGSLRLAALGLISIALTAPAQEVPSGTSAPPPTGREAGKPRNRGGKGGPPGLIKPSMSDTLKVRVYADNWFMLYINGELVAVDPIKFTPHNVVSIDILPEYPMTVAVLAKDNADPSTGLEYGSSIGDGGFCLKIGEDIVTSGSWKAKSFFHGPVKGDTAHPTVRKEELPDRWWAVDFDDRSWPAAKVFSEQEVDPKPVFREHDFTGASFIWSDDLTLDNTVIFRTRIEKPGWTKRWNTKPDLDVTGAPQR